MTSFALVPWWEVRGASDRAPSKHRLGCSGHRGAAVHDATTAATRAVRPVLVATPRSSRRAARRTQSAPSWVDRRGGPSHDTHCGDQASPTSPMSTSSTHSRPLRVEFVDQLEDTVRRRAEALGGLLSSSYRPGDAHTRRSRTRWCARSTGVGRGPVTGARTSHRDPDRRQLGQLPVQRGAVETSTSSTAPTASRRTRETRRSTKALPTARPGTRHYWHPEGPGEHRWPLRETSTPRKSFGFPRVTGLLDASAGHSSPKGLGIPWYSELGNHDGLVQGNLHTPSP